MDGHECTEILYSQLDTTNRLDAEYYSKIYIEEAHRLLSKPHFLISDYYKVTDGEHGSVEYLEEGVKYLTAENIKQGYVDLNKIRYVSEDVDKRNVRASVDTGDILISIKGTLGSIAIAEDSLKPCNMNRDVAIIKAQNAPCNYNYLIALFLMGKYGSLQSSRGGSGGVQQMITLGRLREFIIPIASKEFCDVLKNAYDNVLALREKSSNKYTSAELYLENEIGINMSTIFSGGVAVKSFAESFGSTGRLDAEYYQPKYDKLIQAIKLSSHDKLVKLVDITKSIEPGSDAYRDEGIPFVRISDISKYEISETDKYLEPGSDYDNEAYYLKKDEILFSKDGSVGIAYKVEQDTKKISSSALLHLTVKNKEEILPDYLTTVLNSEIVQLQAERDAGGSIIKHWKPSEIEEVLIPILPMPKQEEISKKAAKSFELRYRSKQLLECAKTAVEMAIEQDEVTASSWLEGKIAELTKED